MVVRPYTVPHCFRKGGGVMCHMYGCERLGLHGPILVVYIRERYCLFSSVYI